MATRLLPASGSCWAQANKSTFVVAALSCCLAVDERSPANSWPWWRRLHHASISLPGETDARWGGARRTCDLARPSADVRTSTSWCSQPPRRPSVSRCPDIDADQYRLVGHYGPTDRAAVGSKTFALPRTLASPENHHRGHLPSVLNR